MMDPYTYREQLVLPKLLVNGTNDPYWVVDAMKLYWGDLKGPKYALFIPNAGHGLDDGREKALRSIAAFARFNASGRELPELDWAHQRVDDKRSMSLTVSTDPAEVRLWHAASSDLDFRDDRWTSQPMQKKDGAWHGSVTAASDKNVAVYAEASFEVDGVPYSLCSLVIRD